jgi:Na+/H+ antiporter NhaA
MSAVAAATGRTAWSRNLPATLREFLRAEALGAAALVMSASAAVVWANVSLHSYESAWTTHLTIRLGGHVLDLGLRAWVNEGLMSFFFFVVGLEARREFDVGELRQRRRLVLPVVAGLTGMVVPVAIYLGLNAGHRSAHGWGAAMSTDTAFALGVVALLGRGLPHRLRSFVVTLLIVDDLVSLAVIVFAYSSAVHATALGIALGVFALTLAGRTAGIRSGPFYLVTGTAIWVALLESGIEPIVVGLVFGLLTYATPPAREDLERATDLFRLFREQPTPEYLRVARSGLQSAVSPNERLQRLYLPWTTFVIVPLFALANAGVKLDARSLAHAFGSRVTLGILLGLVLGKPLAVTGATDAVAFLSRRRVVPPVGRLAVLGGGIAAGTGFTVSLLVANLAFRGSDLEHAKIGILSAAIAASSAAWLLFRLASLLPVDVRVRALLGRSESIVDLAVPVDEKRDHIRGRPDADVTLLEYGDFQCPYCGQAEQAIRELLGTRADVRYVWRHLPLNDVHPRAQLAAEAAEAAAAQGRFWEMHDLLLARQDALAATDLIAYAQEIGLDVDRFRDDLRRHAGAGRIADDVDSADASGVAGTPTFFVNGRRHWGAYDVDSLARAAREAGARARVGGTSRRRAG